MGEIYWQRDSYGQAVGESRMPSKKAYTARIVCPSVLMTLILEIDGETAVKI